MKHTRAYRGLEGGADLERAMEVVSGKSSTTMGESSQQTMRRSGEGALLAEELGSAKFFYALNPAHALTKEPYRICVLKRCYKYIDPHKHGRGAFSPYV